MTTTLTTRSLLVIPHSNPAWGGGGTPPPLAVPVGAISRCPCSHREQCRANLRALAPVLCEDLGRGPRGHGSTRDLLQHHLVPGQEFTAIDLMRATGKDKGYISNLLQRARERGEIISLGLLITGPKSRRRLYRYTGPVTPRMKDE